jgi:hypothetical protein
MIWCLQKPRGHLGRELFSWLNYIRGEEAVSHFKRTLKVKVQRAAFSVRSAFRATSWIDFKRTSSEVQSLRNTYVCTYVQSYHYIYTIMSQMPNTSKALEPISCYPNTVSSTYTQNQTNGVLYPVNLTTCNFGIWNQFNEWPLRRGVWSVTNKPVVLFENTAMQLWSQRPLHVQGDAGHPGWQGGRQAKE